MANEKSPNQLWAIACKYTVTTEDAKSLLRDLEAIAATVRAEERKAAMRDAILLVDTAPLCHCAGKQYVDPVALVQRMNAALEAAAENRKEEG